MTPYRLRSFLAVRKYLSYTRAAEALFLSQPTVSRQIRQLEETLNVTLFEQIGKSLYLTEAGVTLAIEAEKILGAIDRATEAVQAHGALGSQSLRIGASTTPGLYLLPAPLRQFQELHSTVDLRFTVLNSQLVEQRLISNDIDLGFVGAPLSSAVIEMTPVAMDEIVCFAAPFHRLANANRITIDALLNETWIIRERGSATRKLFESWLASKSKKLQNTIIIHSSEEAKLLVEAGVGISVVSKLGLAQEIEKGRFKKLPIAGLKLQRSIYLARHADKRTSSPMRSFLQLVRDSKIVTR